nr:succinate dehydrogenase assembly factor 2 [Halorhodospira abdelmalekii]
MRWRCRRGTKELDLLLERFLTAHYAQLAAAEQAAFERLLAQEDHALQAWLIYGESPPDAELTRIVERIRSSHLLSPR